MTNRRFWCAVMTIWGVASLLLVAVAWSNILHAQFPDPDDQMRLLEVRDWLAGQSWFDVTQYRLAPPGGVPMHWSRLVDLPIAAVVLLARSFVGSATAEQVALVVVPLLTLGTVIALLAVLARRLLREDEPALMSVCVALLSVETLHQLRPMRIDHHGWQMALALVAANALVRPPSWRAGAVVGVAIAAWLTISLEGLPIVAAILALVALRWALWPETRDLIRTTAIVAATASVALFAATHGISAWRTSACDAMSPVYLAILCISASGMVALAAMPLRSHAARIAGLAATGMASLLPIPLFAPACAAGPFGHLDPLVRDLWYLNVMEGLPLWTQSAVTVAHTIALPMIGILGAVVAVRRTSGAARVPWIVLLYLLGVASLAAVFTQRAGGITNLLATPAVVYLLFPMLGAARLVAAPGRRIVATLAVFMLAAPGIAAVMIVGSASTLTGSSAHAREVATRRALTCIDASDMRALAALPRGTILAPLDISPAILVLTPHAAVASGHHRGAAAMHDVIAAFTGTDRAAHAIVAARHIDYVAFCPGLPEITIYEHAAPDGFLTRLDGGRVPGWLAPVEIAGSPIKVWRVR